MIIRERENWFKMLWVWKGSVIRRVIPQLSILFLFSVLVYYFHGQIYTFKIRLNPAIFTLMGVALAIFLGFLNNASYDRFWEGRKLWGAMVIDTRSLTRQVLTLVEGQQDKSHFVKMIAASCWALNYQLRDKKGMEQIQRLLLEEQCLSISTKVFRPIAILDDMGSMLKQWHQQGRIDSILWHALDESLNKLSHIIGGCERIKNTPVPYPYHILLHRTVYIYCFLLPFGLLDTVGAIMPFLVVFIAYTFICLDAIVAEIGEPFGEEENDLALNSLCRNIEYSIFEQAGIPQAPLKKADSYVLD